VGYGADAAARVMRACVMAGAMLTLPAISAPAAPPLVTEGGVNRGVVELETLGTDVSVRIGEDLAVITDDGATRRLLPVVGKGSLQNIVDLKALRGIDMAIVQVDVLEYARQQGMFPGLAGSLTYVTKLYNEEFHLLARRGINSVADLANKQVNVDVPGAGTGVTARRLFDLLGIAVTFTNDDQQTAIEKLRRGDIAAIAFVSGKPTPLFQGLDDKEGLHFLAIPLGSATTEAFVPTRLTKDDYPGLVTSDQPITTVAVGTVLVAANLAVGSPRYRNIANFVDAFFTGFQSLTGAGHHPKWREVNLYADFPGWVRFPPADQWLQRNAPSSSEPPQDLKAAFSQFIEDRQKAAGGAVLTDQQKDELYQQFQRWQAGRTQ
jgi:TRAP-type uncharacterized transport system substrate-binding protein